VPKDVALFFHKETLKQIIIIRDKILEDLSSKSQTKKQNATFVASVLLGIIHGKSKLSLSLPCNQCFAMSPNYVRRFVKEHKLIKPKRNVKECLIEKTLNLLPSPKNMASSHIYEIPAEYCYKYMKKMNAKAKLIITSPPYLDRQTYLKDSWLRLWFLNRDWKDIKKKSLETGSIILFTEGIEKVLLALFDSLENNGKAVIVCGKANATVGGKKRPIKITDLFLIALKKIKENNYNFKINSIISDRIIMKKGSYFAVLHGRGRGNPSRRQGEDDILILEKNI